MTSSPKSIDNHSPFWATMFQAVGLNAMERMETYRDVDDVLRIEENASMSDQSQINPGNTFQSRGEIYYAQVRG